MESDSDVDVNDPASTSATTSKMKGKTTNSTKYTGSFKYKTRFQPEWTKEWPFIRSAPGKESFFTCTVCKKEVSCAHQGKKDVQRHNESATHIKFASALNKQPKLNFFQSQDDKVIKSEVKFTHLLVQQNIPLAFADHLNRAIPQNFPDSKIAQNYSCARTKTSCILNGALAPFYTECLVNRMRNNFYSIATDASNDSGLDKMNPITVRLFDVNRSRIVTEFLDMCLTTGRDAGKAEAIFNKIDECLTKHKIPWENCKGFSVDNTNVNIGKSNSIKSRVLNKNSNVFFMGCPCHILHNTASKAASKFGAICDLDIEDFCIDLYYWFEQSTKRKGILDEFCSFCDIEYKKILKNVSVRWLSLETSVERVLKQFVALKSYFLTEDEANVRFKRLKKAFAHPMTEVYLFFIQATLPLFTNFNKFLQSEKPCLYLLHDAIHSFLKKLVSKFVNINIIKECVKDNDFSKATDPENVVPDDALFVGFSTKQKIRGLLENGEVSDQDVANFYKAVRQFYLEAISYSLKSLPLNDEVIRCSKFVDFKERLNVNFENVTTLIEKLGLIFTHNEFDMLADEFSTYQLLEDTDVDEEVWKEATDGEGFVRMDVIWGCLLKKQNVDSSKTFKTLSKVVEAVFVLHHSNASEERIFSMIKKNKTAFRASLNLEGTLSSIITVKVASEQNQKFNPTPELLKAAKHATRLYNEQHKK